VSANRPAAGARGALEPLKRVVLARFPEAEFAFREAPDGVRCYLDVISDCEDDFAVLETVAAATVELYLQQGIIVHVFPFRRRPEAP
jgi:hypothetical protein